MPDSIDKLAVEIAKALRAAGLDSVHTGRPLSKAEIAEFLGVSERSIDNYVARKLIPHIKLGNRVLFNLPDVRAALQKSTIKAAKR